VVGLQGRVDDIFSLLDTVLACDGHHSSQPDRQGCTMRHPV